MNYDEYIEEARKYSSDEVVARVSRQSRVIFLKLLKQSSKTKFFQTKQLLQLKMLIIKADTLLFG